MRRGRTTQALMVMGLMGLALMLMAPDCGEPADEETTPEETTGVTAADKALRAGEYEGGDAGFVTVNTKPWSRMTIDGHDIGNTPKKAYAVAPGTHVLRLVCGMCDTEEERTIEFAVAAGETFTLVNVAYDTASGGDGEEGKAQDGGIRSTARPATSDELPPMVEEYTGDDAAYMTINAKPWAHAILDGNLVGNTPKKKHGIAPGEHELILRCGECAAPQEIVVTFSVGPGETFTKVRNAFTE